MTYLWLLLIPYTGLAYGIHGGEFVTGINRQVRNLLCAAPFALVAWIVANSLPTGSLPAHFEFAFAFVFFALAYEGVNMGFASATLPGAQPTALHLAWKGFVNLMPLGAVLLPLAYWIGYRTTSKNVLAEYLSGVFYGAALAAIAMVYA